MQFVATLGESVYYRPILIQKYENSHNISEHFNSWMDIRNGIYPNISAADEPTSIGKPLSILIYLDSRHNYDISVNKCWAYNEQNHHISTMKVLLTSNTTESKQNKKSVLINTWKKIYPVTKQNVTTLLYTNTTAFKFPKHNYVYVACTVEICHESCNASLRTSNLSDDTENERTLQVTTSKSIKFFFDKHSTTVSTTKSTTASTTTKSTTPSYNCNIAKRSACLAREINSTSPTLLGNLLRSILSTKSSPDCLKESEIDPRCATNKPSYCIPGSIDPKCTTISTTPTSGTTSISSNLMYNPFLPPNCYPNSKDPRCKVVEIDKPLHPPSHGFFKPPDCYPGSKDMRCKDIL
ncbi:hypothetical protein ILUMI_10038 [Ignelater luminosus]|uniref:ZP domain-containing protein n=1 Tax=Ignelater luminosus TaxID=2038154 RepID=A0A8K0D7X1_IGNLU|nr:hypothetical protein ILUMI_10038 [Ignelater luminosus]